MAIRPAGPAAARAARRGEEELRGRKVADPGPEAKEAEAELAAAAWARRRAGRQVGTLVPPNLAAAGAGMRVAGDAGLWPG